MTIEEREEAIKELTAFKDKSWDGMSEEVIDVAIEALKQEPCEDCISRADAINAMSNAIKRVFPEHRDIAEKTMNKLQSVTPEPKKGRWIKYGVPRCGEQHYQCTSCGYYINFGKWGELYTKEFKYCPNCGAKMEVEE